MVVQVLPHAWQIVHGGNAVFQQMRMRANAGEHEDLGRLQGPRAQQHLARGLELFHLSFVVEFHAHRAFALHQDAGGVRAREHAQVGARQVGRQVGIGRAETLAIFVRHLEHAHPFLLGAVEVSVVHKTGLLPGRHKHRPKAVGAAQIHHIERAVGTVEGVGTALVVFRAFEVRQHVVIGPAGVALRRPVVVVIAVAAGVNHGVHRTGAAQHLAAWLVTTAAIQTGLRHGIKLPVGLPILGDQGQPGRAVDQHAAVGGAGFQQRHHDGRVLAQPCRQHAAGRACADDDVVKHMGLLGTLVDHLVVGPRAYVTANSGARLQGCRQG